MKTFEHPMFLFFDVKIRNGIAITVDIIRLK